jgi:tetratricopeptide (TPR) repeat protein
VARVQGVPTSSNLGQMDQAEQNLQIAKGLFETVLRSDPANRRALLRLSQVAHDRMLIARFKKRDADALALARESQTYLERFHPRESDRPDVYYILNVMTNVADQFAIARHYNESLELCRRGVETAKTLQEPSYGGNFDWIMASVLQSRGDLEQALEVARQSVARISSNRVPNPRSLNINIALSTQGKVLAQDDAPSLGRYPEAVAAFDQAFQNADRLAHSDSSDQQSRNYLADAGINLADALRHTNSRRALEVYDHTLSHLAEIKNNPAFRRFEACALINSTYVLRELGRSAEARNRLDAARQRLRDLNLFPASVVDLGSEAEDLLRADADHEAATGSVARALASYQELLRLTRASNPDPNSDLTAAVRLSTLLRSLSALQHRAGLAMDAAAARQRDHVLWMQWDRALPGNSFVQRQLATP